MDSKKFWFVWNPQGRAPTYKHETRESAEAEATRLACLNEGETFVVLESLGHFKTIDPVEFVEHEIEYEIERGIEHEPPF